VVFVYYIIIKCSKAIPLFISLFNGKETRNTSSGKYTRTRLSSTNIWLTQYGNSLGYTQFHIVETKETAFADLSQRLEQMKCLNTLMNTRI
jgi:hypothetical protein